MGYQWALGNVLHGGGKLEERGGGGGRERGESGRQNKEMGISFQQPRTRKLETVTPKGTSGLLACERRGRTLSSLSQSPPTLFDSSFWKYF